MSGQARRLTERAMMSKILYNSDSGGYGCGYERFFGGGNGD
jgi:hypothetical protein